MFDPTVDSATSFLHGRLPVPSGQPPCGPLHSSEHAITTMEGIRVQLSNLLALQEWTTKRISSLSASLNHATPIHRLPLEILVHILELSLPPDGDRRLHTLSRLQSVSKAWHHTIRHTPILWARISAAAGPQRTRRAIELSTDVPLCVEWGPETQESAEFLDAISIHIIRWRSARFTLNTPSRKLSSILSNPAPLLESFTFRVDRPPVHPDEVNPEFFRGHASRLVSMELEGVWAPWNSPLLSGLHSLTILRPTTASFTPQILESLAAMPRLQSLTLGLIQEMPSPYEEAPSVVYLPILNYVALLGLPFRMTTTLLSALDAPICNLRIDAPSSFVSPPGPVDELLRAIHHLLPSIESRARRAPAIHLSFDKRQFNCTVDGETSHPFSFLMNNTYNVATIAEWLLAQWAETLGSTRIRLDLGSFDMLSVTRRLGSTTSLYMISSSSDSTRLLRTLALPSAEGSWLWPQLTTLKLPVRTLEGNLATVVELLHSRYARARGGGRQDLPCAIRTLEVVGGDKGLPENLADMISPFDINVVPLPAGPVELSELVCGDWHV